MSDAPAASPKISVQISTYNRRAMLERCLASLVTVDFDPREVEVIVVDDGGADGTREAVEAVKAPFAIRYIWQPHAGLASARNRGITAASGDVVLFLDDDVLAAPALLDAHWRGHQEAGRASVVVGRVHHIPTPDVPRRTRPRLADASASLFWTCNASVRRCNLFAAGLFDERFTEYGWEDLEFSERLRTLGLRRRRSREALVYHIKPPVRGSDLPRLVSQAEASGRSAVVYVQKALSWRARLATGLSPARMRANLLAARLEPLWWRIARRAGSGQLRGTARVGVWFLLRARYYRAALAASAATVER